MLSLLRGVIAAFAGSAFIVGCGGDFEDLGVTGDALTAGESTSFAVGDRLTTTARLNLRSQASRSSDVVTIMPSGAPIKVTAAEGGGAPTKKSGEETFVHVDFQGKPGWASTTYVQRTGSAPAGATTPPVAPPRPADSAGPGAACMNKFAEVAKKMDGEGSQHRCYHYVKEHLGEALGIGFEGMQTMVGDGYQMNAADFASWIEEDPGGRASGSGFVKADIPIDQLPIGAVIVWQPGQCGYSSSAGHIEIVIGGGRACSDFCGRIKTNCGAPTVVTYQKGC